MRFHKWRGWGGVLQYKTLNAHIHQVLCTFLENKKIEDYDCLKLKVSF